MRECKAPLPPCGPSIAAADLGECCHSLYDARIGANLPTGRADARPVIDSAFPERRQIVRSRAMVQAMRHPHLQTAISVATAGFVVGIGYRAFIDEEATRELANYLRSGVHGVGIAVAGWIVQNGFTANAQSSLGAALRRLSVAAELVVRSLVMTAVIVIVGVLLQVVLYADSLAPRWFAADWFITTLPWVIVIGLAISVVVGAITETVRLIGGPMLASITLGTYHRPVREQLIVMFLDIAGSTRLAEERGELFVHDLITRFFFDIDGPIASHGGAVHSYVGDEVIVTWPLTADAARNARCLQCVVAIESRMASLAADYMRAFNVVPRFRAGLHCGPVIVSECGSAKRQLAFFGDTMNVAARLCEYCKVIDRHFVISGDLLRRLVISGEMRVSDGQSIALRGRQERIEVHAIA
jgi:class 3 adenylate cyclase